MYQLVLIGGCTSVCVCGGGGSMQQFMVYLATANCVKSFIESLKISAIGSL